MKASGIYSIQSKCKPDRIYIGSATNMTDRWSDHLWKLNKQIHENPKIQRHYNKYGKDDLVFRMIEPCLPQFLIIQEQEYIKKLKPYFNICKIAGSHLGCKRSEESKLRMSIAQKKRKIKHSPEAIEKNRIAHLGKTPWNKGKKATLQARRNQSIAHMGKGGWNKGLKRSDEVRLQISIRQKGRIMPPEVREKISKSMMGELNHFYGKKHSDETKKKIGQMSSMRRKRITVKQQEDLSENIKTNI
jgi:group I intron endonuclease